jgi:hypothetical protein
MQNILLRNKIDYLKENFDDLTSKIDELNSRIKSYLELQDNNHYVTVAFIDDYKIIKSELNKLLDDTQDSFQDKHFGEDDHRGYCQFKDHCAECINNEVNHYDFCASMCKRCKYYRKMIDNNLENECKLYFNEHIVKKPVSITEPKKITNVVNINNNLTINNNNLTINNYIQTKDLIFYVTITSTISNPVDKLRYMFTYLMCGSSGIRLFPNEAKYSKAVTFPVSAAKYNIINDEDTYILQGVLRYTHGQKSSMTIKKLEQMGDNNYVVKAYCPNNCNNNRTQLIKTDIDRFVDTIRYSENGSNVEDFYIQDIV